MKAETRCRQYEAGQCSHSFTVDEKKLCLAMSKIKTKTNKQKTNFLERVSVSASTGGISVLWNDWNLF